jgi:hypothetical protein
MYRVLIPGGRVTVCVWRSLEHNPFNQAVSAGLGRYVSAEAAASIRAPFACGNAQVLRTLMADAGFHAVEVQAKVLHRPMLQPEESIPGYLASTPMAQTMAALAAEVRRALFRDIGEALQRYRHPEGLVIPQETHIALAYK